MQLVFLLTTESEFLDLETSDGLPVSEHLLFEINATFPKERFSEKSTGVLSAGQALQFLRDFYSRYELSQPQRRIQLKLDQTLANLATDQRVRFVVEEVSEHRSRRKTS